MSAVFIIVQFLSWNSVLPERTPLIYDLSDYESSVNGHPLYLGYF